MQDTVQAMVEGSEIESREGLEAWLKDQPPNVATWIACRAAARLLPHWWAAVKDAEWARDGGFGALPVLHSLLVSSLASQLQRPGNSTSNSESPELLHPAYWEDAGAADHYGGFNSNELAWSAARAAYAAYNAAKAVKFGHDAALAAIAEATIDDVDAPYSHEILSSAISDAGMVLDGAAPDFLPLWLDEAGSLARTWIDLKPRITAGQGAENWAFWIAWYDALLEGRPMLSDPARTSEMLERIARIDPEIWKNGPEAVNSRIREIWERYLNDVSVSSPAVAPETVSDEAKSTMRQRVAFNRDALAISVAGLLDQLGAFKEHVRGINHLDPLVREDVITFIDAFTGKLSALMEELPLPGMDVDDARAGRLVLWLREYRELVVQKLKYFGSAENMAEATVPTAIILAATGVGAMIGMPVAGPIVGGLIANQMKPGQAAKELVKPSARENHGE